MASDPIRILIVDDDEEALIALERLLEEEGYSTVTAWGGKEALALSDQGKFDLLLVDEHGADVSFDTLLAELRRRQPSALPLVMHSGRGHSLNTIIHHTVCKWKHAEVTAGIRRYLAA
ncbi:MAG TPA: response regulator [Terriglobales bacterium]|nr:response regulator [Terriglobales bacterium]